MPSDIANCPLGGKISHSAEPLAQNTKIFHYLDPKSIKHLDVLYVKKKSILSACYVPGTVF